MTDIKFYYHEWKTAEKEGNKTYALKCKKAYRDLVLKSLEKPYRYFNEKLKAFPAIILN